MRQRMYRKIDVAAMAGIDQSTLSNAIKAGRVEGGDVDLGSTTIYTLETALRVVEHYKQFPKHTRFNKSPLDANYMGE